MNHQHAMIHSTARTREDTTQQPPQNMAQPQAAPQQAYYP